MSGEVKVKKPRAIASKVDPERKQARAQAVGSEVVLDTVDGTSEHLSQPQRDVPYLYDGSYYLDDGTTMRGRVRVTRVDRDLDVVYGVPTS